MQLGKHTNIWKHEASLIRNLISLAETAGTVLAPFSLFNPRTGRVNEILRVVILCPTGLWNVLHKAREAIIRQFHSNHVL